MVTELLSFLLPLLLMPHTRSHSPAADTAPLKSGISFRGQRWAAVHRNSLQKFDFRMPFSPLSCTKYKLLHVTLHLKGTNLWHKSKINCNPVILPLLHSVSKPLLAVFGEGWKEEIYELKRPGRRKVSGQLTWRNMQAWKCCRGKANMI